MSIKTIGNTRTESISRNTEDQPGSQKNPEKKKFSRYREWRPGEKYLVPLTELQRRLELALKRNDFIYAQLLQDMIDLRAGEVVNREATEIRLHYRNSSYNGL